MVLYAGSRECLESVTETFVLQASRWSLTVSIPKIKGMAMGESLTDNGVAPLSVGTGGIEMVEYFTIWDQFCPAMVTSRRT